MGEGREGVTETELEAAGRTEAKAGGARDRLTGRRTERPGRRRAPAARAQAGLRPETGRGCRRQPWTGRGSEGAERLRAGGPTTEGFSVGAKVGIASPSCTPGAAQSAPPAPPPVTLTAELKITAPCAPRRPRPQPLPRPLPHWAWDEATAPSSPKEKKKKEKAARGGGGRAGGGGPGHMDVISPLRGRRAAPQRSAPARPRLPPFLLPLSSALVRSLALGAWAPRRAPGPRAAGPPGYPRPGRGRGSPA